MEKDEKSSENTFERIRESTDLDQLASKAWEKKININHVTHDESDQFEILPQAQKYQILHEPKSLEQK